MSRGENKMEIEIKIRVGDVKSLKKKLSESGVIFKERVENIDRYFTPKHKDFLATKECLRIRTILSKDSNSILTYKPPTTAKMKKAEFIWKDEIEVEVKNCEDLIRVLNYLGCKQLVTVYKTREKFQLNGFTLTIDNVRGLGFFMEIEKLSNDNVSDVKKNMWKILKQLGFSKKDVEPTNYRDLVLMKQRGVKAV